MLEVKSTSSYGHWKPVGAFLEQTLRSKLRAMGTLRLLPTTLALRTVQRHAAASRSARSLIRVQHGVTGGLPTVRLSNPLSTFAHTPSLSVSFGHFGARFGTMGMGVVEGGIGSGFGQVSHAETIGNTMRLKEIKRAKMMVVMLFLVVMFCCNTSIRL
ncbi:hypothetical protein LIER_43918 [Lithospermum erythrorhizon]|uniref:Uncharacterized protein n=1 Tax=Lithospermum erythrorhizon TaxID=34254 RepID=A0AAV3R6R2_LITER